jgi:hypothetical protein
MLSTFVRVMCCMFLFQSAFSNVGSAQGTRGGAAQAERKAALGQKQFQAEHQQLLVLQQRLEVQEQQLGQQQEQIRALNQLKDQQQQLVRALTGLVGQLSKGGTLGKVLPSLIAGLFAVFLGFLALNFNEWSTRRTARQDHIRMLMDVDSRLIERPWLWSIYRNRLEAKEGDEEKLKQIMDITKNYRELQEDAMLYLFFNMFEAVHDFHQHLGFDYSKDGSRKGLFDFLPYKARRKADLEYKQSWDRFAQDFFCGDGGERAWTTFEAHRHLYSDSFRTWFGKAHAGAKKN